jgi:hypothetical protein
MPAEFVLLIIQLVRLIFRIFETNFIKRFKKFRDFHL